jgi:hypothetical protein
MAKIREPVMILGYHLYNIFSRSDTNIGDKQVNAFKGLITDAYDVFVPLCRKLSRHSNVERLRVVYEYLVGGGFINFVLCAEEALSERVIITECLIKEFQPLLTDAMVINRFAFIL